MYWGLAHLDNMARTPEVATSEGTTATIRCGEAIIRLFACVKAVIDVTIRNGSARCGASSKRWSPMIDIELHTSASKNPQPRFPQLQCNPLAAQRLLLHCDQGDELSTGLSTGMWITEPDRQSRTLCDARHRVVFNRPLQSPGIPCSAEIAAMFASSQANRTQRILWLDDDDATLALHWGRILLETLGYEVATATNGWSALELLGRTSFGLVILDYDMPKFNGAALAREIKQNQPVAS